MSDLTPQQDQALRTARVLLDLGHPRDSVLNNPVIPEDLRDWVAAQIGQEANRTFERARVIAGGSEVELLAGFSDKPEVDVAVRIVGLETP